MVMSMGATLISNCIYVSVTTLQVWQIRTVAYPGWSITTQLDDVLTPVHGRVSTRTVRTDS